MSKPDEELPPVVTREQASAAGLIAAFLFFGLAVGAFFILNAYWPAAKVITKVAPSADSHRLPQNP